MTSRWAAAAAVGAIALALSGCGVTFYVGKGPQPLRPAPSIPNVSPTLPPAPPGTWSKAVAAQEYVAIVAPSNQILDQLRALGPAPYDVFTPLCTAEAKSLDIMNLYLRGGHWPKIVKAQIATLTADVATEESHYAQCAAATSNAELSAIFDSPENHADDLKGSADAAAVRAILGLPSNQPTTPGTPPASVAA